MFLRTDGSVWTTDKDGIILSLLAAEITAKTEKIWRLLYEIDQKLWRPVYERIDAPASPQQKTVLSQLSPEQVSAGELAGEPITVKLTQAPENQAALGGLKVCTENGWFAARPSGTENVYKIYAESFNGPAHLKLIQAEARTLINTVFANAGV